MFRGGGKEKTGREGGVGDRQMKERQTPEPLPMLWNYRGRQKMRI